MQVAGSKEFVSNQREYFDLAIEEDVCVENSQDRFHFMYNSIEEPHTKERVYYQPDEDFYRSISMDELRKSAHEHIHKLFERK